MIDIILFALIAFFIGYRLFKVLGDTKYDREISPENKEAYEAFKKAVLNDIEAKAEAPVRLDIPSELESTLSEADRKFFMQMRSYDSTLTAEKFVNGASIAFGMILKAISEGDLITLERLCSEKVFTKFKNDIDRLSTNAQRRQITLVGIKQINIKTTAIEDGIAKIALEISSEQISNVVDSISNGLISGSLTKIKQCEDRWTFAKALDKKEAIWKLVNNE